MSTSLFEVICSLFEYNAWANRRILAAASGLAQEQFLAPAGSSYASVRDTLVHCMSAEWIWLSRWQGTSPDALFKPADFPGLPSIQTRWEVIEADTQQFITTLNPERLSEVVAYTNTRGERWAYPLWQLMFHRVNHSTQHRSETAAMLTDFGRSPGNLDYLVYMDQLARKD